MALNKDSTSLHYIRRHAAGMGGGSEPTWIPNTDVYCTDNGLVIKVELAGMKREDLELTIEGNQLRISGHRPDGCRAAKCQFLVMEINYGSFESMIEVPASYDLGRARAAYQNGFLRIDVPPAEIPPSKTIEVPVSGGP